MDSYSLFPSETWKNIKHSITKQVHVPTQKVNEYGQEIENTSRVSFDIKFTSQGFENASWHAFSKPSLVNLISKDANLVFYLSVNLKLAIMT